MGAIEEAAEVCLDRGSGTVKSVVERVIGGEAVGGVLLFEACGNVTRAGSVVRRDVGGWRGVAAGVEDEEVGTAVVPTVAKELVGLPRPGMLKSGSWGELGFELALDCTLSRNCWRASSRLRC